MATLTAETVTAGKDGLTFTDRRRGVITREITNGQAVEEAAREAALLNQQSGDSEVTAIVNGSNAVQKVADGVRGVVQRLELYRGDKPLAWTFLHESLEADWQAGVQAGVFTLEGTRAAAGSLARFIYPARVTDPDERRLAENLHALARGEGDATMLRETVTEFAMRDVVGRGRYGRGDSDPGSFSRIIADAIGQAQSREEARGLSRLAAWFRSVRAWLASVPGTVRQIQKARGKQGFTEWESHMETLLGISDQGRYDSELAAEIEAQANQDTYTAREPTQEEMEAGMVFSLSSPAMLGRIAEIEGDETTAGAIGLDESFHASRDQMLNADPAAARDTRQGRGKAGFYTAPVASETEQYQRQGSPFVHRFEIPAETRVKLLRRPGQIERLTPEQVAEWREQGFGAVVGRAILGQKAEVVLLNAGQSVAGEMAFSVSSFEALPKRTDKPSTWEQVGRGHPLKSVMRLFPRVAEEKPAFPLPLRGSFEDRVNMLASWLAERGPVVDPWGGTVTIANPQKGGQWSDGFKNRAAHLIGMKIPGTRPEQRKENAGKLAWLGATETTIREAQARALAPTGETLYLRSYKGGVHMVVAEDGKVKEQFALVSQYAPENLGVFEGARVEQVRRISGPAAQGGAGAVSLPGQLQGQTEQTPSSGAQEQLAQPGDGSQPAFSLSPAARLQAVVDALEARLDADPEQRLAYRKEAQRRVQALADKWSRERWTGKGDRIRPIEEKRSPESLDNEQAMRQALREAELFDAGMALLTPATVAAYEQGRTTLEQDPLISAMLGLGRLMSKTEAARAGKLKTDGKGNAGDYDGAPWLPPSWYAGKGAGYMPDRLRDLRLACITIYL